MMVTSLTVSHLLYYLQWLSSEPHRQVKHPQPASVAANYTSGPAELLSYKQPAAKMRKTQTKCSSQPCQIHHSHVLHDEDWMGWWGSRSGI